MITYTIYYRTAITDEWTPADPDLFCDRVRFACAPGMPTATLSRDYGYIVQRGSAGSVAALDLRGKLIRIDIADGTATKAWYGYCPVVADSVDVTHRSPQDATVNIPSGRQTYSVYGMEYLLQREQFRRSYITGGVAVDISLPYNQSSSPRNTALSGHRSGAKVGGIYVHDTAGTDTWTALNIVEVLLHDFAQQHGVTFTLAGQFASLANIIEPWGELSDDFLSVLKKLINPARGFTFFIDNTAITVISITDEAVGDYVPANANIVSLTLDQAASIREASITHIDHVHYDKIRVEGEPIRVCFTMSPDYVSTLAAGWTSDEQTEYNAHTDDTRPAQSNVYCRFVLSPSWHGYQWPEGLVAGGAKAVMPAVDPATGAANFASVHKFFVPNLVLDRSLPLDDHGDPRPPLVWYQDAAGTYQRIHNPRAKGQTGASVRVLDDGAGFRLDPQYPHYFGLSGPSNPAFNGVSSDPPKVDWNKIGATVSMYTHARAAVERDAITPEPGAIPRTKIIRLPNAHLWYVIDGTVIDVTESALTKQVGNLAVRDDTEILRRLADMARVYYGRSRAAIKVRYSMPGVIDRLGHVVKEAYSGGATTPAGTLLTEIDYDFIQLELSLSTEWTELDLAGLVRQQMSRERTERRISRIEENLANTPVQVGGGGGAVGTVPVRLTAKTDATTYTGNVFANGTDKPATETGATIRVLSIAATESIPLNNYFLASQQPWAGVQRWTIDIWRDLG